MKIRSEDFLNADEEIRSMVYEEGIDCFYHIIDTEVMERMNETEVRQ